MASETAHDSALTFGPDAEAEFESTLAKYPNKRAALLPVLYIAQREFKYLSPQAMEYVAERLELPPSKVLQVATFYTMYYKRPHGRHHIEVCTSVPCCMMGGYEVMRQLKERLGVEPGEVTPDGKFTYAEAECLAGCGHAPLMQINSRYHENLTPERIDAILADLD
ncbi:MAG: NADH-quinone oxidoreductase E subunit [Bradymonadia bacterium]|jgi:NADH-quinone oxidoreductase E subunit